MTMDANQKKLVTIFGLFFIPLAIAATWYLVLPENYRPGSMTNNGNLLDPIYPMQAFEQQTKDGEKFTGKNLEKKWTLVHLIKGNCDEACSKWLYNTRQVRIALAEDMERVTRLSIVDNAESVKTDQPMWDSHPDMEVVVTAQGGVAQQILQRTAKDAYPENSIYLIDPLGNLMMHFPPDIDPKLLMKDLEKLLKLSHIG